MRWKMYRWWREGGGDRAWCEGGGDRAWWVIESVFLRSPEKGFWACLGDLPPDMLRRPETWVSLCNLMLKLRDARAALAPQLSGGTRVCHWQSSRRLWPDTRRLQLPLDDCCRLVLRTMPYSMQLTEQIHNDPPRMGAKSTTTSNHPSTPLWE